MIGKIKRRSAKSPVIWKYIKQDFTDYENHKCSFLSEPISKMHLTPNSCVVSLLKMLTYERMLRFCVGSRLALERDLPFLR